MIHTGLNSGSLNTAFLDRWDKLQINQVYGKAGSWSCEFFVMRVLVDAGTGDAAQGRVSRF